MSLVGKFGNFEVKNTDRISQEDSKFLQHHEEIYQKAINACKKVYSIYLEERRSYSEADKSEYKYSSLLIDDFEVPNIIDKIQQGYVERIYDYFRRKYSVSLESNFHHCNNYYNKYYDNETEELEVTEIDYNKVIDNIIEQLGGLSFADKRLKEVKDELRDECYNKYRDSWRIKLKGNTITYTDGYGYVENRWCRNDEYEYHNPRFLRAVMKAISIDKYGFETQIPGMDGLYNYSFYLIEDELKSGFYPIGVPIEKVKIFKNGRVDLKFKEADQARKFVREWCGYPLN